MSMVRLLSMCGLCCLTTATGLRARSEGGSTPGLAAREAALDADLESRIGGISGNTLAHRYRELARRRSQIMKLQQMLQAEQRTVKDRASQDLLRSNRKRLDGITTELARHFQTLGGFYDQHGSGSRENTDVSLESQIAGVAGEVLAGRFHELAKRREHISDLRNALKAEEDSTQDQAHQGLLHAQRERLDGIAAKMSQHFQSVGQLYDQSHAGSSSEKSKSEALEATIASMVGEAAANWFHGLAASRDGIQKLRNKLQAEEKAEEKASQETDTHKLLRTQRERLDRLAIDMDQHFESVGDLYGTPGK